MLGERIANLRKTKGISQEELADVLLTSRQAISKWERGEASPDIDRLKDLAIYFDVSIDYLLDYDSESTSVKGFIARIDNCFKNKQYDITLDEIRMIVFKNKNNFNLLVSAIDYLSDYYAINRNEEIIDVVIDYCQKAIAIYQPNNRLKFSINDLHRSIVYAYMFKHDYETVKQYVKEHNVYDVFNILAEAEFELGNYEASSSIISEAFMSSISNAINCNYTKVRLLYKTNQIKEGYEVADWSIKFIQSIDNNDFFLEIIYSFMFFKAVFKKCLNLDNQNEIAFLKERVGDLRGFKTDENGVKFYEDKKVTIVFGKEGVRNDILEEINGNKNNKDLYEASLEIFESIFKGD